jgi:bacillithiol biosynthesis cysteine-adding enzyme BshC
VIAVDIRRFPWIRPLASDYVFNFSALAPFFAGDATDDNAWREAIHRTQQHPRRRDAVADLLHAQQARRGAPAEALRATELLRNPRTVAVVTGQQAGLFGGPLFTLFKAITAMRQAAALYAEQGVPAIAIFWVDAEDHDWNEVKSCRIPAGDSVKPITIERSGAAEGSIASVSLDESIATAVAELEATLQSNEFTPALLEALRRAYRPGIGMADAFARWLETVLGRRGLIVYDASDAAAKPLVADLFARELEHPGETCRRAAEAGRALEQAGYHAQVTPAEGAVALFHLGNGGREAIRQQGEGFLVGDREYSAADLLARARQAPQEFSPNVLLRPLVQDTLFPTVCYVAGPNELAYLAQLRGVYEAFGLPMPLFLHRASATIVDANAMRFLTKYDCPLASLAAQDEAALNELLAAQLPPAVEASLQDAEREIEQRLARVIAELPSVDPTLEGAARSTQSRIQDDLKKLHAKVIQAAKRKDDTLRRQFLHARSQAFPGGHPQEREVGFVHFLNKYGPTFVDCVHDALPLTMGQHWVLTI